MGLGQKKDISNGFTVQFTSFYRPSSYLCPFCVLVSRDVCLLYAFACTLRVQGEAS